MTIIKQFWKEASTVILIRKSNNAIHHSTHKFNYKILMLERSGKSKFMPSAYVFPGGQISKADFDPEWKKVLRRKNEKSKLSDFGLTVPQYYENRSPMLSCKSSTSISNNVAFRLCGIRETFEEIGILLEKNTQNNKNKGNEKANRQTTINSWREKIHKDDSKFVSFCNEFNITPDIWSIYEWSNWLTPVNMKSMHGDRRFDTMFYISFTDDSLEGHYDDKEIVAAKWFNPVELLNDYYSGKLWLAPPQVYELGRLFKPGFGDFDTLKEFAIKREEKNVERYMPVRIKCTDGIFAALPGDDLYPEEPDFEGVKPGEKLGHSMEESRINTKNLNRFEMKSPNSCTVHSNIQLNCGHITPKTVTV